MPWVVPTPSPPSAPFRARDVPHAILDPDVSEQRKEQELYRSIRIRMRAEDTLRRAALPPRMQRAQDAKGAQLAAGLALFLPLALCLFARDRRYLTQCDAARLQAERTVQRQRRRKQRRAEGAGAHSHPRRFHPHTNDGAIPDFAALQADCEEQLAKSKTRRGPTVPEPFYLRTALIPSRRQDVLDVRCVALTERPRRTVRSSPVLVCSGYGTR